MRSRILVTLFGALLAVVGCRDLVVPEDGSVAPTAIRLEVVGLGSDGYLDGALVTIDNGNYVGDARVWTATTDRGEASFVGAPAGTYDVRVEPDRSSNTPAWTVVGATLGSPGDALTTVAYEGLDFEIEIDWPELARIGPAEKELRVRVLYRMPVEGTNGLTRGQVVDLDATGSGAGALPWTGRYQVVVDIDGAHLDLVYAVPDSVALAENDILSIPSPIQELPVSFLLGGDPDAVAQIYVEQYAYTESPLFGPDFLYVLDREEHPDSMYLLPGGTRSTVVFSAAEDPRFLSHRVFLDRDATEAGTIELGSHALRVTVSDADDQPVADATVEIDSELDVETDAQGQVTVHLDAGAYRVEVSADGYEDRVLVVEVTADQMLDVALEVAP